MHALVAAPDGSWLAAACEWQPVRVWDPADGRLRHSLAAHPRGARLLVVAPHGSWLAAGGYNHDLLWRWDPATGERLGFRSHPGPVTSLAVAPDGAWLVTGTQDGVATWDPDFPPAPGAEPGHVDTAGRPALAGDGSWIATPDNHGVTRVWDPRTGAERRVLTAGYSGSAVLATPAADPTWLAVGVDAGMVHIWEPTTGHRHRAISAHPDKIIELAAAPDGSWLATSAHEAVVRVWDPASGELLHTLDDCSWPLVPAPDGSWLATGAEDRHTVVIWDLSTGERRHVWRIGDRPARNPAAGDTVEVLALSADGNRLAAVGSTRSGQALSWVWDVRTGEPCAVGDQPGPGPASTGGRAVRGETLLRVWDGLTTQVRDLVRHELAGPAIQGFDTSPDGRWLAVVVRRTHSGPDAFGAAHGEITVYDIRAACRAAAVRLSGVPTGCQWSTDGSALFAYGQDGLWGFTWITGDPPPPPG